MADWSSAWSRSLGVTYRQLDYWAACGYLGDDVAIRGPGSGRRREFSETQRQRIRLLAAASTVRLDPGSVARAIDAGDSYGTPDLLTVVLSPAVQVTFHIPDNATSPVRLPARGETPTTERTWQTRPGYAAAARRSQPPPPDTATP